MPYTKYHDPWGTGAGGATPIVAAALDWIEAGIATAQAAAETADVVPVGAGWMWFTNTAPSLCVLLRGQAISRTTYAAAFALWGILFGAGDGSTTFNAPNLEGRIPIGKATSGTAGTLGATFGDLDHVHALTGSTTEDSGVGDGSELGSGGFYAKAGHHHTQQGSTNGANPPALVVNFVAYMGV